ncbi:MAG: formylglycine-generating enzyme family protein [Myxococcota bacterium]
MGARPPAWACRWGEDRCGRYAGFELEGVEHILRWIPPGTFVMGSPEDEAGRISWEGPQHRVELTEGFWLGETPVTQALWKAVMGAEANPSQFVDDERPVEQVSHEDVEAFLERSESAHPGLGLRLPTEAQWEYACRAGTAGAVHVDGTWAIDEDGRAPLLEAIAWYGATSREDFDLEGHDQGTRKVATRRRNPWGLHDMLGNVWEWCRDGATQLGSDEQLGRVYTEGASQDPFLSPQERPRRVVRGGSWNDSARNVRAACRLAYARGSRLDYLGFRVSRGPGP